MYPALKGVLEKSATEVQVATNRLPGGNSELLEVQVTED